MRGGWAAQIRAPSLGAAAAYVRRGLPGILRGITNGYKVRTDLWSDRLKTELKNLETVAKGYIDWWSGQAPGAYEAFSKRVRG